MDLRRFLNLGGIQPVSRPPVDESETATVRRIMAELEALEPEQRRHLAGFAYILTRAAHADLHISDNESRLMEQIVMEIGKLPQSQAVLVVEIAKHQTQLYGATEDYLVTREFAKRATEEQRIALVEACFAVVAADHTITAEEYAELTQIARELDLSREQLNVIRREYREHLAAIQHMRGSVRG
ncbi:MAG TPA: TerB family tellurite resistance protein [Candidatus Limnocylindria bacterium]|nr:TerB family tellurite resistance protein [Candidatus Limnocylindria bacterium]